MWYKNFPGDAQRGSHGFTASSPEGSLRAAGGGGVDAEGAFSMRGWGYACLRCLGVAMVVR